jgi:hypothetical protein
MFKDKNNIRKNGKTENGRPETGDRRPENGDRRPELAMKYGKL